MRSFPSSCSARPPRIANGKSPAKAPCYRWLCPALGEFYAGGRRSARFFLATEGICWTGMSTFRFLESYRIDAYRAHAAVHAGIRLDNLPESFIKEVGNFNSITSETLRERFLAGEHGGFTGRDPRTDLGVGRRSLPGQVSGPAQQGHLRRTESLPLYRWASYSTASPVLSMRLPSRARPVRGASPTSSFTWTPRRLYANIQRGF